MGQVQFECQAQGWGTDGSCWVPFTYGDEVQVFRLDREVDTKLIHASEWYVDDILLYVYIYVDYRYIILEEDRNVDL